MSLPTNSLSFFRLAVVLLLIQLRALHYCLLLPSNYPTITIKAMWLESVLHIDLRMSFELYFFFILYPFISVCLV